MLTDEQRQEAEQYRKSIEPELLQLEERYRSGIDRDHSYIRKITELTKFAEKGCNEGNIQCLVALIILEESFKRVNPELHQEAVDKYTRETN